MFGEFGKIDPSLRHVEARYADQRIGRLPRRGQALGRQTSHLTRAISRHDLHPNDLHPSVSDQRRSDWQLQTSRVTKPITADPPTSTIQSPKSSPKRRPSLRRPKERVTMLYAQAFAKSSRNKSSRTWRVSTSAAVAHPTLAVLRYFNSTTDDLFQEP